MSATGQASTSAGDDLTVVEGRAPEEVRSATPGSQVGRYVVIEEAGRGGMGAVLRVYDPKLRREVALKRLSLTGHDEQGRARLVREAQAMAQLSHPNTVAVYDVDIDEAGEVALAMEYVPGVSFEEWRQTERPWSQVVEVLVAAGRGLAAAHRADLVHRDFKPANILVRDDDGAVKVTDFGLATVASDASLATSSTSGTSSGLSRDSLEGDERLTRASRIMGTPRFMAPEQHLGQPVGPAADQYAFCVTAWLALTGEFPFRGKSMDRLAEAKVAGPPAWPRSSSVPARITETIRRGLAPDPNDRWPDLTTLLERLRPAPARRWGTFALLGVGIAVVAAGSTAWIAGRDAPCRDAAAQLADVYDDDVRDQVGRALADAAADDASPTIERVQASLDTWADEWQAQYVDACEATSVRGEQSNAMLDKRMACLRRAKADLTGPLAVLLAADAQVLERAVDVATAVAPPLHCGDLEALEGDVPPPEPGLEAERVEEGRAILAEAMALRSAGKYHEALARIEQTPDDVAYLPYLAERDYDLGVTTREIKTDGSAVESLRRSLARAFEAGDLVRASQAAAQLSLQLADSPTTRPAAQEVGFMALALARRWSGRRGKSLRGLAHTVLGVVLRKDYAYDEAETHMKEALRLRIELSGANHPSVALSRNSLGNVYIRQGRYEDAAREYRAALDLRLATLGPDHPHVATSHNNLGGALSHLERWDEAIEHWHEAIRIYRAKLGEGHPNVAMALGNIAAVRSQQGRFDESIETYRQVVGIYVDAFGDDSTDAASAQVRLGDVLRRAGRLDEALEVQRSAVPVLERLAPRDDGTGDGHFGLAQTYAELGRLEDARRELQAALDIRRTLGLEDKIAATEAALAKLDATG